jgi:predicted DNA-binding protein (UPF0251 family)
MNQQQVIDELRERIARLEAVRPRRRVYNQQEAAREVGMSVNKFRREMNAGRVKGILNGRVWSFTDEELQRYVAGQSEGADA